MKEDYYIGNRKDAVVSVAKAGAIILWLVFIRKNDAFYSSFIFMVFLALLSLLANWKMEKDQKADARQKTAVRIISVFFSLAVIAGNYEAFSVKYYSGIAERYLSLGLTFFGGTVIYSEILMFLIQGAGNLFSGRNRISALKPSSFFLICFILIASLDLLTLFLGYYPGTANYDSIKQIWQGISGQYVNHHPFYHTYLIHLLMTLGQMIFGDINAGMACFSVFQIMVMACTFSYMLMTLLEMRIHWIFLLFSVLWFAILPFNIFFSFTMWKDTLYGAMAAGMVTSGYRILSGISSLKRDKLIFAVTSAGFCLMRTNGWLAFLGSTFVFLFVFPERRKMLCACFAVLAITFVMTHQVLQWLHVPQTDLIESLSIPLQQISRSAREDGDLTADECSLLEKVVDVDRIGETYTEDCSDPMKDLVRETGDQEYLKSHIGEYLKLWINIGLRHPETYIKAWIRQTRGLWNAGYSSARGYVIEDIIGSGSAGIHQTVLSQPFRKWTSVYPWIFMEKTWFGHPLQLFVSMGLLHWLTGALLAAAALKKKKIFLIAVPVMMNLMTLLLSTPVSSEFRYVYPSYTIFPLLLFSILYSLGDSRKK